MSNFLREHLKLSSVDSTNIVPKPVEHYLGKFMPPGFEHIEGPKRGVNVLDTRPKMNKIDKTVFEVVRSVDSNLPEIKPIG